VGVGCRVAGNSGCGEFEEWAGIVVLGDQMNACGYLDVKFCPFCLDFLAKRVIFRVAM
jgi:hypothetical protein